MRFYYRQKYGQGRPFGVDLPGRCGADDFEVSSPEVSEAEEDDTGVTSGSDASVSFGS